MKKSKKKKEPVAKFLLFKYNIKPQKMQYGGIYG